MNVTFITGLLQLCPNYLDGNCEAVLALSMRQGSETKPREMLVYQGKRTVTGTDHRNIYPTTGFVTDLFHLQTGGADWDLYFLVDG